MKYLLLMLFPFVFEQSFKEKELFLLPPGYIGNITIIHSQRAGQPKVFIGKRRAYYIPSCGVLKTQFPEQFGTLQDDQFLFVHYENGKILDTISYLSDFKNISSTEENSVFVFCRINGGAKSDIYKYNYKEVVEYGIDTLKNRDKYNTLDWHFYGKKCN